MSPDDAAANPAPLERFVAACEAALRDGRFERLLLSGYRGPVPDLKRVTLRAIELRGAAPPELCLQP